MKAKAQLNKEWRMSHNMFNDTIENMNLDIRNLSFNVSLLVIFGWGCILFPEKLLPKLLFGTISILSLCYFIIMFIVPKDNGGVK